MTTARRGPVGPGAPPGRDVRTGTGPGCAGGGSPTGQPLTTLLTAVAAGAVVLSSSTDAACLYETPLRALLQQEWTLLMTVAPRQQHG